MKLRIRANSLRLRLTQGEVAGLAETGECAETMALSNSIFTYRIRSTDQETVTAESAPGLITVAVPKPTVAQWAGTGQVSIRAEHGPLAILIEKDFACLQPRPGEDDVDTFPHPNASGP